MRTPVSSLRAVAGRTKMPCLSLFRVASTLDRTEQIVPELCRVFCDLACERAFVILVLDLAEGAHAGEGLRSESGCSKHIYGDRYSRLSPGIALSYPSCHRSQTSHS